MLSVDKIILRLLLCAVILWLAFTVAVMSHEWTHGLFAWIFGYKSSPFAIDYGGWSIGNTLIYVNIDQAVNDYAIALIGHPIQSALILIIPPIIVNGGLTLFFIYLLRRTLNNQHSSNYLIWFLYCSVLINFGEFFSYTCLRSFSTHADVGLFLHYMNWSPWIIFVPGLYLSLYGFHLIFSEFKPALNKHLHLNSFWQIILSIFTIIYLTLFVLTRSWGSHYGPVVNFMDGLTIMAIPYLWWRYCRRPSVT